MNRYVVTNILINLGISSAFVLLNIWALNNGLEETFVFLAIFFGVIVVIVNAFMVHLMNKK